MVVKSTNQARVFSAKVGLIARQTFEKNRRYAVLVISILADLLTPTPDVVNMLLMGGPLYLLYEAGILVIRILQIDENRARDRAAREAAAEESQLLKEPSAKE